uniref:GNAT family N-acetyltransferase n=1 Tax=Sphingomonas populi TaxID=2484750 RepID=UPI0019D253FF|nr:GNAT family N-acetyltransferase [Sphingomonas populi]
MTGDNATNGTNTPSGICIRPIDRGDADQVAALLQSNAASRGGALFGEYPQEKVEAMSFGEGAQAVVAVRGGKVVGVLFGLSLTSPHPPIITAMLAAYPGGRDRYVYGPVCIDASERGRGLLRLLYDALRLRFSGLEAVLFIREDNTASRNAHESLGMKPVSRFFFDSADYTVFSDGPHPLAPARPVLL